MGAPKKDYELVAPPHSFIHVDDYTPTQLAKYLHYLDGNSTAYNEYFAWKAYGKILDSYFYCRLCAFVQTPSKKIYTSIEHWWRRNSNCNNYINV
uniref:Fucosyltransferase n=1 Tax=Heterorhabditis bacteriophora TaxID=37862 RepID=A0A1I7XM65_HETBA